MVKLGLRKMILCLNSEMPFPNKSIVQNLTDQIILAYYAEYFYFI